MSNFTNDVKRDLLKKIPENRCCRLALLSAFLQTSGCVLSSSERAEIAFTSENEEVAACFLTLFEELFGVGMTVAEAVRDPKLGRNKLTFLYAGRDAIGFLEELSSAENFADERDCCSRAFLAGVFLGGGSCTIPREGSKTGYHLEFVFRKEADAENFCELLERFQLIGNVIARGEKFIVYFKSREAMGDFLYVVGARAALKRLENVSEERDRNNRDNRVNNCYIGNADKTAIASAEHIVVLKDLQARGILNSLPEPLLQTAQCRMENPTLSLTELAERLHIGKSCLNHRMRKLMQIYARTEKEV